MFAFGSLLQDRFDILKTHHPALSNIQQAASTLRSNPSRLQSCSQAFNKQRKWHITPSLSLKRCIGEKKKILSSVISQIQVYLKYRQGKMKGFFSGLALHMTAIWGYCVFWPERVVYDRWQERKSRAAGLSTDMQIAFSWLPYSAWYLSSGLQYASLFTARKQLINSTKGGRKESWCFSSAGWKYKPFEWPVSTAKLSISSNASCFTARRDNTQQYRQFKMIPDPHWY